MTCAGAAGVCEKYLADPALPDPKAYPPAVRFSVPPVRLGRRVEANGARPASPLMAAPIRDFGKDDRSYLTPEERIDEVVNRRTVALMAL